MYTDLIREQPHFRGVEYCTSTIQLNIKVDPKVNVSYQWYRFIDNNEHQISNNDHFSGVNGCQLEIKDLKKEHAGEYYCVISIGNVHICSRKARLQVKGNLHYHHYSCVNYSIFTVYFMKIYL